MALKNSNILVDTTDRALGGVELGQEEKETLSGDKANTFEIK